LIQLPILICVTEKVLALLYSHHCINLIKEKLSGIKSNAPFRPFSDRPHAQHQLIKGGTY
jgi:hypothetical protein